MEKLISLEPLFYLEDTHFDGCRARNIHILLTHTNYQHGLSPHLVSRKSKLVQVLLHLRFGTKRIWTHFIGSKS